MHLEGNPLHRLGRESQLQGAEEWKEAGQQSSCWLRGVHVPGDQCEPRREDTVLWAPPSPLSTAPVDRAARHGRTGTLLAPLLP